MKKNNINYKKYKFTYIKTTLFTLFGCMLFLKGYTPFEKTGENYFHIMLNGQTVGTVGERDKAEELLIQARRNVASASSELMFMTADMGIVGEEVLWGAVYDEEDVIKNMESALKGSIRESLHRSYTMKVNDYLVNLASIDDVVSLLQAAINKYGGGEKFSVELKHDTLREFSAFTTNIVDNSLREEEEETDYRMDAGIEPALALMGNPEDTGDGEMEFEDYEQGILTMDFAEEVEVVETYLPENQLTSLEVAIDQVIKEQEVPGEYEVVSGDTLSEIAIRVNIPMDRIVEMNDSLESINSTLQIGQKLIITVPEPELSVTRVEQRYYEEYYDAEIEYIENDDWFTNQEVVRQKPSTGFRKVVADVSFVNDKEVSRQILKEEVVMEAVAKVVERGTKIPPTYIKPIYGGRRTSTFGPRRAPVRGASTYHKGVDWATATGTPVYASCGGTVAKAGWGSGYGYVVYINHIDGRQTRYAHLSKVLVSSGQYVKQGDRIALSGNTGVSSGPHLHFEMLINGSHVNPENYLDR